MNKCKGCGILTDKDLCERCFRIKHYNEYKRIDVAYEDFLDNLDKIDKDDLVVLVVDLLNIPKNFDDIKSKINNKMLLALNKFDLMPTDNEERYKSYFEAFNLNLIDIFCISSKNNYHIDDLYNCIKNNANNKVYFIGYTNSGKSSLINKIMYNYSSINTEITTSYLANTTLDMIEIKLDGFSIIDTPGIITKDNKVNNLSDQVLKKLSKSKRIKPISYQIKGVQYIIIEDIMQMKVVDNDIIIYVPSNITVDRYYKDKNSLLDTTIYDIDESCDIVIPNVGFIKIIKKGKVEISKISDIDIFMRKVLI